MMRLMKIDKTILAFDTAMAGISVGVIGANGNIVSRQFETQREQTSLLIPTIQEVLDEAHLEFKDIDFIASSIGPGSFTGLRIGLTTAKTMTLSLNIPLIGLSNLEVMAHHYQNENDPLLIVLETKRQDFYAQYFDIFDTEHPYSKKALTDPFCGDAQTIIEKAPSNNFIIGGDCLERFSARIETLVSLVDSWMHPDPILMAQLAFQKYMDGYEESKIEPLYLRGADVSHPKNPPRKLKEA